MKFITGFYKKQERRKENIFLRHTAGKGQKMKKNNKNNIVIFDNYNFDYIEEARECLEDFDSEYAPSDQEVYELASDLEQEDFDRSMEELKSFFGDSEVIFSGSLGRWDGYRSGFEVGTFETLFYDFVKDCDYITVTDENGHLYINCSHHDGSNFCEVKKLTEAGKEYFDRWEYSWNDKRTNADIHKQLKERYSRLPRFAQSVYGF